MIECKMEIGQAFRYDHTTAINLNMFRVLVGILILQNVFSNVVPGDESKIDPTLAALLKKNEKVNVVISFKSGIRSTLSRAASVRHADRGTHNTHIINELEKNADSSQAGVLQMLNTRNGESNKGFKYFKQYKTSNSMYFREATADFVRLVSQDSQVSKITKEPVVKWVGTVKNAIEIDKSEAIETKGKPKDTWHIERIQVREAWEVIGSKGDGVVIGILDSGSNVKHESLRDNFRGEYGWFDTTGNMSEPYDYDRGTAHGSHVTGIAVGTTGSGVAPGAKWMACSAGFNLNYPDLKACIEWFQCPTLPDGSARNCSKTPHVINNSWESVRNEPGYWDDLFVWRELGIIPVFAAGNGGGHCNSATSPGEYPFLISVGISRHVKYDNEHHRYTAVGPSTFGPIKPDLSAPGEFIYSTGKGEDRYTHHTGTSMASPVIAGVVALLKVRDPDMTYDEVYELLTQNTDDMQTINMTGYTTYCKNQSWQFRPNNFFGFGVVNALKAVNAQTELLKLKGKL